MFFFQDEYLLFVLDFYLFAYIISHPIYFFLFKLYSEDVFIFLTFVLLLDFSFMAVFLKFYDYSCDDGDREFD